MHIINRTNLETEQFAEMKTRIPIRESLMEVYGWFKNRTIDKYIPEVVKQDEFSLDVIFSLDNNNFVVYGTS